MRKVLSFFALTIGVGLAVWLVIAANFTAVVHSFAQIGWGIAAIILGAPGLLVWRVIEARHLFSPDLQAN